MSRRHCPYFDDAGSGPDSSADHHRNYVYAQEKTPAQGHSNEKLSVSSKISFLYFFSITIEWDVV